MSPLSTSSTSSEHYALPAPLLDLLSQYLKERVTPTIEID